MSELFDEHGALRPHVQAAIDRAAASRRECEIAWFRFSIEADQLTATLREFADTAQAFEDRIVFEHPDVMELDLRDAAWNPEQP